MEAAANPSQTSGPDRLIAPGLVVMVALSTQMGAAFAVKLFPLASPTLAACLRNGVGALLLLGLLRLRGGSLRGLQARLVLALGVVLATMNATFYEAINRLPLGDAVAVEFIGPIAVAVIFSQARRDLLWVGLATLGIVALGHPGPAHLSYAGLAFILAAATCWGLYLVLARRLAIGPRRADGLAAAMAVSAIWLLPLALYRSPTALADPRVLGLGAAIGLFSSAVPYSLELLAMRRVSATVYGVLLSLQPLVAALMGFVLLGQRPGALEAFGFLLVIAASIGVNLTEAGAARELEATPAGP